MPALQVKMRGKIPGQIRYVSYCEWAQKISKIQREITFKHYILEEVLNYIRGLVPNVVKVQLLEDSHKVSLKLFGKNIWKKVCSFFLVKLHSAISNNIKMHPIIDVFLNYTSPSRRL